MDKEYGSDWYNDHIAEDFHDDSDDSEDDMTLYERGLTDDPTAHSVFLGWGLGC